MAVEKRKSNEAVTSAMSGVIKWTILFVGIIGTLYLLASVGGGDAGADKLNTLFLRLTVLFGAVLLFGGWNVARKIKYQKEVLGKVLCEFITKEGNSYTKLFPLKTDGMVEIKSKQKRGARTYALDDLGTYASSYPPGKWSFLQTTVKKAVLDEDSFEPLSNRRAVISLSPMRLANLINERTSALGVAYSLDEAEHKGATTKNQASTSRLLWIVLIMVGVTVLGLGYFIMTKWSIISEALGV